jgi:hypothetical protein
MRVGRTALRGRRFRNTQPRNTKPSREGDRTRSARRDRRERRVDRCLTALGRSRPWRSSASSVARNCAVPLRSIAPIRSSSMLAAPPFLRRRHLRLHRLHREASSMLAAPPFLRPRLHTFRPGPQSGTRATPPCRRSCARASTRSDGGALPSTASSAALPILRPSPTSAPHDVTSPVLRPPPTSAPHDVTSRSALLCAALPAMSPESAAS